MASFVNAIEEVVVKEAREQIELLRADMQQRIRLSEVVAYALNRLPCLYATSREGWINQQNFALVELSDRIAEAVRRGTKIVLLGDPLHDKTPLPKRTITCSAGTLYELWQVLGKENLRWRDIPMTVEANLERLAAIAPPFGGDDTIVQMTPISREPIPTTSNLSSQSRSTVMGIKAYLKRKKAITEQEREQERSPHGYTWGEDVKKADRIAMDFRELESYTLRARLGFTNVLEHLVLLAAERLIHPDLKMQIDLGEVAAYALNQLPPMYATSAHGFRFLRQHAISDRAKEIATKVRASILKVMNIPSEVKTPVYIDRFELEMVDTLVQLRQILKRDDITLSNIVEILKEYSDSYMPMDSMKSG